MVPSVTIWLSSFERRTPIVQDEGDPLFQLKRFKASVQICTIEEAIMRSGATST